MYLFPFLFVGPLVAASVPYEKYILAPASHHLIPTSVHQINGPVINAKADSQVGLYRDNETSTLYPQDGNVWAIKANLTLSTWAAPKARPSPKPYMVAGAHYIASQSKTALDLIRRQWGLMLEDPRMTQSTFIEGYSTDGAIHYAPYSNNPRISHAHGWSTGPIYALSHYAAGLQIIGPAGSSWLVSPQPGNLTTVDAGLENSKGLLSVSFEVASKGGYESFSFKTPSATKGDVKLPGVIGTIISRGGKRVRLVNGVRSGRRLLEASEPIDIPLYAE